ncbi:MAG: hypothetical protein LBJ48_06640 [Coriobacteriales bacterium]|jgi:hypothetical protein|nr:hypothetical protein [Coriobacteriales bacterium]
MGKEKFEKVRGVGRFIRRIARFVKRHALPLLLLVIAYAGAVLEFSLFNGFGLLWLLCTGGSLAVYPRSKNSELSLVEIQLWLCLAYLPTTLTLLLSSSSVAYAPVFELVLMVVGLLLFAAFFPFLTLRHSRASHSMSEFKKALYALGTMVFIGYFSVTFSLVFLLPCLFYWTSLPPSLIVVISLSVAAVAALVCSFLVWYKTNGLHIRNYTQMHSSAYKVAVYSNLVFDVLFAVLGVVMIGDIVLEYDELSLSGNGYMLHVLCLATVVLVSGLPFKLSLSQDEIAAR